MTLYRYLAYNLTLQSPAIITIPGGDPNSSSTLPYIPGTAVRGSVAKALGDPSGDETRQDEFKRLILGGAVHYLNAYPLVHDRRALPAPISLKLKKLLSEQLRNEEVIDLAARGSDKDLISIGERGPSSQLKAEITSDEDLISIGEGFLTIGSARPELFSPGIGSRIHHQRDREQGRAWKDKEGNTLGAIFTFESLDANQAFAGLIQLRGGQEEELDRMEVRIKALLGDFMLVGRSRRAGYGGMAEISWKSSQDKETVGGGSEGWQFIKRGVKAEEQFRILLTSPCIIRNPLTGQQDPAALETAIVECFGGRVRIERKIVAFETAGGFNRKWRMELPQALAVSAGSVLVLSAVQDISEDELAGLMHKGLGERKEEGYGRFIVLDKPQPVNSLPIFQEDQQRAVNKGQPNDLAIIIERRILQSQLTKAVELEAAKIAQLFVQPLPKNSLIGRLRTPLRKADKEAIMALKKWLNGTESEKLKRSAMEQLERCKKDGQDLRSWMIRVLEKDSVLDLLNVTVLVQRFHVVSKESAQNVMGSESETLSVKLIDAVLAGMAIRNKTEEYRNAD